MVLATPFQKTAGFNKVLVTGLGRSGTSAVASVLSHFGYLMTESPQIPSHEDPYLRDLLKNDQADEILEILERRSASHSHVAWKDPKIYGSVGQTLVDRLDGDWLLVVIFRDLVAVGMRRALVHAEEFTADLHKVIKGQRRVLDFATDVSKKRPVLYISYEKMMTDPHGFINEFAEIVDWPQERRVPVETVWRNALQDQTVYRSGDS
jgi:hypothetical protein